MRRPLLVALLAMLAAALISAAPAFGSIERDSGSGHVPPELKPPAGQKLVLKALGSGSQVYDCDAATGKWVFREPVATLSKRGKTIGIHYAGPTWELFDGSKVTAAVKVNVPAPEPTEDIPWLLLGATSNAGSGVLSTVDYIQRLHTDGGVAPNGGVCDPAKDKTAGVHYTAIYTFYSDGE
jgi:FtsP/CotA-like multicopper oxidase with cupredoxin domain